MPLLSVHFFRMEEGKLLEIDDYPMIGCTIKCHSIVSIFCKALKQNYELI